MVSSRACSGPSPYCAMCSYGKPFRSCYLDTQSEIAYQEAFRRSLAVVLRCRFCIPKSVSKIYPWVCHWHGSVGFSTSRPAESLGCFRVNTLPPSELGGIFGRSVLHLRLPMHGGDQAETGIEPASFEYEKRSPRYEALSCGNIK